MALDVKVKIDLKKPIGKSAFGYPLILTEDTTEIEYTECKSLEDVVTAGYDEESNMYKAAALMFQQDHPPAKIAVMTATTSGAADALPEVATKGWRQLVTVDIEDTSDIVTYIATTTDKMFFTTVTASTGLTALSDSDRVVGFVHNNPLTVAALVGEAAGRDVGSFTYKNLILRGIEPEDLSDSTINAITAANGIAFVTKAGDNVTTEGKAMSGEYIDIVDSKDYVISNLEYQTQKMLNTMGKIPYDNNGIAVLESAAVNVMNDAYNKGIIATNDDGTPGYSVDYATREETDESDRVARKYLGGHFSFKLAGAVHEVEITGEIEI